ncbi:MAG: hypothetical protein ACOCZE_08010 [Planctomycetota bacterium]
MRPLWISLIILAGWVAVGCDRPEPSDAASSYDPDLDGQAVQIYTVEPDYDLVLTPERKRALRQQRGAAGPTPATDTPASPDQPADGTDEPDSPADGTDEPDSPDSPAGDGEMPSFNQ